MEDQNEDESPKKNTLWQVGVCAWGEVGHGFPREASTYLCLQMHNLPYM